MALFDSIIGDAQTKFDLGGKAERLLSAILALMTNDTRGGLRSFLDKFGAAGFGEMASSWVNTGANREISGEQLETTLGSDMIKVISSQSGLDSQTTTAAAAFMIPRIVDKLTPNGTLPDADDLLSINDDSSARDDIKTPLTSAAADSTAVGVGGTTTASDTFDRIGTSASEFNDAGASRAPLSRNTASELDNFDDAATDDNSPLKWLIPLLLLGLLVAFGAWFCGGKSEPVATTTAPVVNVNKVNTNAANTNATAAIVVSNSNENANIVTTNANK